MYEKFTGYENPKDARALELLNKMEDYHVFTFEGRKYAGLKVDAVKQFIKDEPEAADFGVWLQDNYIEVKESNGEN